mgnify:FL=1
MSLSLNGKYTPSDLRIGDSMAFEWVSDPSHVPDMPHHVGHFWHPDCGWAVLIEVAND